MAAVLWQTSQGRQTGTYCGQPENPAKNEIFPDAKSKKANQ